MNNRLRLLRKSLNLTQQEFADRLGVKRNTIANYETGRNEPVDSVFSLICREFNVNPEWLRDGTGDMNVEKSTFSLDDYANANKLTDLEKEIIRNFMELEPDVRSGIYNFFNKLASASSNAYNTAPNTPQELEKNFPPINDDDAGANLG